MGFPMGRRIPRHLGCLIPSDVSISANTEVNSIVFTPAATNPYTITASPGLRLTISGVGIVNNSGRTQNFLTSDDASGNAGTIVFSHHASAGSNVSISNEPAQRTLSTGPLRATPLSMTFGAVNCLEDPQLAAPHRHVGGSTNFFDQLHCGQRLSR